jgi:tetratricopeptide (TPR) repeat protein
MRRNILIVVCIMVMGAGLSACSDLPQIRLLHDPLTAEEHVMLGLTYEDQGYRRLAAQEYRTALTREAGFVPALIGLGNVAFAEGEMEESEAYYQQALTASPDHPGANNNLAMLYLARGGRLAEAERLALRALAQRGPLRPYVLDTLAHVYAQQGRYTEAVTTLEEAEAAAPSQDRILHGRLIRLRNQLVNFGDCAYLDTPMNTPIQWPPHQGGVEWQISILLFPRFFINGSNCCRGVL